MMMTRLVSQLRDQSCGEMIGDALVYTQIPENPALIHLAQGVLISVAVPTTGTDAVVPITTTSSNRSTAAPTLSAPDADNVGGQRMSAVLAKYATHMELNRCNPGLHLFSSMSSSLALGPNARGVHDDLNTVTTHAPNAPLFTIRWSGRRAAVGRYILSCQHRGNPAPARGRGARVRTSKKFGCCARINVIEITGKDSELALNDEIFAVQLAQRPAGGRNPNFAYRIRNFRITAATLAHNHCPMGTLLGPRRGIGLPPPDPESIRATAPTSAPSHSIPSAATLRPSIATGGGYSVYERASDLLNDPWTLERLQTFDQIWPRTGAAARGRVQTATNFLRRTMMDSVFEASAVKNALASLGTRGGEASELLGVLAGFKTEGRIATFEVDTKQDGTLSFFSFGVKFLGLEAVKGSIIFADGTHGMSGFDMQLYVFSVLNAEEICVPFYFAMSVSKDSITWGRMLAEAAAVLGDLPKLLMTDGERALWDGVAAAAAQFTSLQGSDSPGLEMVHITCFWHLLRNVKGNIGHCLLGGHASWPKFRDSMEKVRLAESVEAAVAMWEEVLNTYFPLRHDGSETDILSEEARKYLHRYVWRLRHRWVTATFPRAETMGYSSNSVAESLFAALKSDLSHGGRLANTVEILVERVEEKVNLGVNSSKNVTPFVCLSHSAVGRTAVPGALAMDLSGAAVSRIAAEGREAVSRAVRVDIEASDCCENSGIEGSSDSVRSELSEPWIRVVATVAADRNSESEHGGPRSHNVQDTVQFLFKTSKWRSDFTDALVHVECSCNYPLRVGLPCRHCLAAAAKVDELVATYAAFPSNNLSLNAGPEQDHPDPQNALETLSTLIQDIGAQRASSAMVDVERSVHMLALYVLGPISVRGRHHLSPMEGFTNVLLNAVSSRWVASVGTDHHAGGALLRYRLPALRVAKLKFGRDMADRINRLEEELPSEITNLSSREAGSTNPQDFQPGVVPRPGETAKFGALEEWRLSLKEEWRDQHHSKGANVGTESRRDNEEPERHGSDRREVAIFSDHEAESPDSTNEDATPRDPPRRLTGRAAHGPASSPEVHSRAKRRSTRSRRGATPRKLRGATATTALQALPLAPARTRLRASTRSPRRTSLYRCPESGCNQRPVNWVGNIVQHIRAKHPHSRFASENFRRPSDACIVACLVTSAESGEPFNNSSHDDFSVRGAPEYSSVARPQTESRSEGASEAANAALESNVAGRPLPDGPLETESDSESDESEEEPSPDSCDMQEPRAGSSSPHTSSMSQEQDRKCNDSDGVRADVEASTELVYAGSPSAANSWAPPARGANVDTIYFPELSTSGSTREATLREEQRPSFGVYLTSTLKSVFSQDKTGPIFALTSLREGLPPSTDRLTAIVFRVPRPGATSPSDTQSWTVPKWEVEHLLGRKLNVERLSNAQQETSGWLGDNMLDAGAAMLRTAWEVGLSDSERLQAGKRTIVVSCHLAGKIRLWLDFRRANADKPVPYLQDANWGASRWLDREAIVPFPRKTVYLAVPFNSELHWKLLLVAVRGEPLREHVTGSMDGPVSVPTEATGTGSESGTLATHVSTAAMLIDPYDEATSSDEGGDGEGLPHLVSTEPRGSEVLNEALLWAGRALQRRGVTVVRRVVYSGRQKAAFVRAWRFPTQPRRNSKDCGVFILLYIALLLDGRRHRSSPGNDDESIENFRRRLFISLNREWVASGRQMSAA